MKEKERPEGRKLLGKNRVYSSFEWLTCQEPGENRVQSRKPSSIQDTCTGLLCVEYLSLPLKILPDVLDVWEMLRSYK